MEKLNNRRNYDLYLGIFCFLILLVLSLYFYLERTAFLDISFHLFYIIKDGGFAIQNNRFISVVTQVFPLLGSKAGLPLNVLMVIYSTAFVVYYFAVYLVIRLLVKEKSLALLFLLSQFFIVTDTFYWIQSEFPQGLAMMAVYFALVLKLDPEGKYENYIKAGLFFLAFVLVFSHPLLVFPFLFFSIYLKWIKPENQLLYPNLFAFLLLYGVKHFFLTTIYDASSAGNLRNLITQFPDYFDLEANINFFKYCLTDYYLLPIGFLAVVFYYLFRDQWLRLVFYAGFFLGYLLLVNVSYPTLATQQFYIENLYLPLGLVTLLPLIFEVAPRIGKKWLYMGLVVIFLVRGTDIFMKGEKYRERVEYLSGMLQNLRSQDKEKVLINEADIDVQKMMMTWASPYECWLLSTHKGGNTMSVLIDENIEQYYWTMQNPEVFITKWGVFNYTELPGKYFRFEEGETYKVHPSLEGE